MSELSALTFDLSADNSNGKTGLHLTRQDHEYFFCLTGEYKGSPIQIDFDMMLKSELEELSIILDLILETHP